MEKPDEIMAVVRAAILRSEHVAKTQKEVDGLYRLVEFRDAQMAWQSLFDKEMLDNRISEGQNFESVAWCIGRVAAQALIDPNLRKTGAEISAEAKEAARLAARLAELIAGNMFLVPSLPDLWKNIEIAAFERIIRGVTLSLGSRNERKFAPDIETELDVQQASMSTECKGLTTDQALEILYRFQILDGQFENQLRRFSEFADASKNIIPILPRPNHEHADKQHFALGICGNFEYFFGSPCIDVATSFVSAVFDFQAEYETVKKWWQRRSK
jgi:hypothetical protein